MTEMYAISGWFQLTGFVIPAHPVARPLFRTGVRAHLVCAQWRLKLEVLLNYTNAQAAAIGTRAECFNLLAAACPFV